MNSTYIILLLLGSLLILGLAIYALLLWRKIWQRRRQLAEQADKTHAKLQQDLTVLAHSLIDGQAPWVEGCIRIKVVLEHYDYPLSQSDDYAVFQTVYAATADIPTHDAWKALPRTERRQHEHAFIALEQAHKPTSLAAAQQLLSQLARTPNTD